MISYSERSSLVNWTAFEIKSDNPPRDFEALCRTLVRLAFEGYGTFIGYRQQSGVEFLLELTSDNALLGKAGTIVGWQCKYFRYDKRLNAAQKSKIKGSYEKMVRDYPQISKLILWTPEALSKGDQKSIRALRKKKGNVKKIVFWEDDMVLALSSVTPRTSLLLSYFGQYSFNRKDLENAFEDAIAPISARWKRDAHFVTKAEERVRRSLMEIEKWRDILQYANEITKLTGILAKFKSVENLRKTLKDVSDCVDESARIFASVGNGLILNNEQNMKVGDVLGEVRICYRNARGKRSKASFLLQNVIHHLKSLARTVDELYSSVAEPIIAVTAAPGMGKTHLAISVAASNDIRPAGLLLLAKYLRSGEKIDEFVRSQSFAGRTFENLDALLNALDSAGRKHHCCMPLVIDGLNESENPADWKDHLALLTAKIKRNYQYVKVVVTYRRSDETQNRAIFGKKEIDYGNLMLPERIAPIVIERENPLSMVARYFKLYKISYHGSNRDIETSELSHPLLLRVFCETNKGLSVTASDLHNLQNLFRDWVKAVGTRILGCTTAHGFISESEYEKALECFAELIWLSGGRHIRGEELDRAMNCLSRERRCRWSYVLADEGLASGFHDNTRNEFILEAIHDQMAGYLIAKYLGKKYLETGEAFEAVAGKQHLLGADILQFLVKEWMMTHPKKDVFGPLREELKAPIVPHVLRAAALECPEETKKTLWTYALECEDERMTGAVFSTCVRYVARCDKAFNGMTLEMCLYDMSMAKRDSLWGRWVYRWADRIYACLESLCERKNELPKEAIQSIFYCCKWLCSSNVPPVRDLATRLLCALGEKFPSKVLRLIGEGLVVNDLFVLERLVAAGYGTCIYVYNTDDTKVYSKDVSDYASSLENSILANNAPYATAHYGVLNYAINTIALISNNKVQGTTVNVDPFCATEDVDDSDIALSSFALQGDYDFTDKDIAYLAGGRDYQTDTLRYKQIFAAINKRVHILGYRNEIFKDFDTEIRDERYRFRRNENIYSMRFGKKYGLIAYMEMKGCLEKEILCWNRWHDMSIDPTFPEAPEPFPIMTHLPLIRGRFTTMQKWVLGNYCPDLRKLICGKYFTDSSDEWVLVDGYLSETDNHARRIFVIAKGFLSDEEDTKMIRANFRDLDMSNREFHYSFHGESPWSLNWRSNESDAKKEDLKLRPEIVNDFNVRAVLPRALRMETFAVRYTWESYHSPENTEFGLLLGSYFAQKMGLKLVPHKWEYVDTSGKIAARFYSAKSLEISHDLLYIRKDVLESYAKKRKLDFCLGYWGERQVHYSCHDKYKSIYIGFNRGDDMFMKFYKPFSK